jgi:hypothetical protein
MKLTKENLKRLIHESINNLNEDEGITNPIDVPELDDSKRKGKPPGGTVPLDIINMLKGGIDNLHGEVDKFKIEKIISDIKEKLDNIIPKGPQL